MKSIAILLIIIGVLLFSTGIVLLFADKLPWLGHLPGDFHFKGKNMKFYFPLTSCILISVLLTLVINILFRFFGK